MADTSIGLGIIFFLILLNASIFYLPLKVRFAKHEVFNHIIRYGAFILGWVVLAFNTTIFATMADTAGLGITHELFVFQWFFLKAIYILMLILFIKMLLAVPTILKQQRVNKRMGNDEG